MLAFAVLWLETAKMHPSSTSCDFWKGQQEPSFLAAILRRFGWLDLSRTPYARHGTNAEQRSG
ncbi:hypothetical protein MALV_24640 [Mycolicibacterium alvei]|uniref:Uncharacterized protein n=1 Tax=Mycolicibacterium alvei TaxID=67081 RepID=A0A6N4USG7_9MYCO|nr:hypothetical protein MALV_24640 [Mycolicibacterium alvei]